MRSAQLATSEWEAREGNTAWTGVFISGALFIGSLIVSVPAAAEPLHRYIVGFHTVEVDARISRNIAFLQMPAHQARSEYTRRLLRTYGMRPQRNFESIGAVLVEASDREINELAGDAALGRGDGTAIRYIEEDRPLAITKVSTNDPFFAQHTLWGLENTSGPDINAPEAWNITTGSSEVIVGVLDTGIDYAHPDLSLNMWRNEREIAGNGIDDDQNGFVDDSHGYDFYNGDGDPFDDHSHGTHVAGTIGAVGNNALGVVGVNWRVKLMALKFLNASGAGWTSGAVASVQYATFLRQRGENIRVLNGSFAGGGYSQALRDALLAANHAGIVFVSAAGNGGANNDLVNVYPANYDLPNNISVTAITNTGLLAGFANYGATRVHIGAPGTNILSTVLVSRGGYGYLSGTSMAAPHVAGTVALLYAQSPGLSPIEVRQLIIQTATPLALLIGKTVAGGSVNAHGVLVRAREGPDAFPISGRITAHGTPVAHAVIDAGPLGRYESDADGSYLIPHVPRNTPYTLSVRCVGIRFEEPTVSGTLVGPALHNFEGTPARYTLRGRVLVGGQPLPHVRVNARELGVVSTDEAGMFTIPDVSHGVIYQLSVDRVGYRFSPPVAAGIATSDVIQDFVGVVTTHRIFGRVTVNGLGVAGVNIDGGGLGKRTTGSSGEFFFQNVPHGYAFVLEASKRGLTFDAPTVVGEATGSTRIDFTAAPSRHVLSGRVEQDGLPLRGVHVRAGVLGSTFTDEAGRFSFENLRYGTAFSITVTKGGIEFRPSMRKGVIRRDMFLRFVASSRRGGGGEKKD